MILRIGKRLNNSGFSLLEIMIASVILSTGLIAVLNSFIRPMRAQEISTDYFKAGLLAERKMFEVCNGSPSEGMSNGIFEDFDKRFSWDMDALASEGAPFMEVKLKVIWHSQNKNQDLSVSTYI
jgi:prepilin-type N-terminal cleavage/methylation domain-containing protein